MEEFEKTTLLFDGSIRIKNKKGATQTKPNVHIVHDFGCVAPDAVICRYSKLL